VWNPISCKTSKKGAAGQLLMSSVFHCQIVKNVQIILVTHTQQTCLVFEQHEGQMERLV
jgi:hypothetical protein